MPHIDISLTVTVQAQPQIYSRALGGGAPLSTENILHHTTSTQAMEAVTPTSTALGAEESDGQSTGGGLTKVYPMRFSGSTTTHTDCSPFHP